jgi:hypothetical protein
MGATHHRERHNRLARWQSQLEMVPPHLPVVITSAGIVTVTMPTLPTPTLLVATTGEVAMMTRMLECVTEAFSKKTDPFLSAFDPSWLSWRTGFEKRMQIMNLFFESRGTKIL